MRPPRLPLAAALAALLRVSSPAAARSPRDRAEARTLAVAGRKALKEKRWTDALAALKKADTLDPSAAIELDLAQAQIGAGKLVEAARTLSAVAARPSLLPAARPAREAAP